MKQFSSAYVLLQHSIYENYSITQVRAPRVGSAPNAAVQRGPIALPNLLCTPSASHKSFVRAIGQLTRS
jgi:hypothetical protein